MNIEFILKLLAAILAGRLCGWVIVAGYNNWANGKRRGQKEPRWRKF